MMKPLSLILLLALVIWSCGGQTAAYIANDKGPIERPEELEPRRVWAGENPDFYISSPSPDGNYITEVDWSTGDLSVIDLLSGKERRITNKGAWRDSTDYAEYSVFSPDGQQIAYTWFNGLANGYEVRLIRLDGSDMRVLFPRNEEFRYLAVEDWSKDGNLILVTAFRTDRSVQIGLISVSDGKYQALKTTDWRNPIISAFSRDGRYVAFDMPVENRSHRDIFLLATDGSREERLVTGPGNEVLLGWLPDGSGILYHSRTKESRAIWALRVENGKPAGHPQMIRPVSDLWPFGFSRDAFYFGVNVERRQIHSVAVDLANGRALGNGESFIVDPVDGAEFSGVWSPDGQRIATLSVDLPGNRLVIRSAAGELQQQLPLFIFNARKPHWMPDGAAVLVYGTDFEGREGIHRVDLRTGSVKALVVREPNGEGATQFFTVSPDGAIYSVHGSQPGVPQTKIIAYDPKTGKSWETLQGLRARIISVSPDGKTLAFTSPYDDRPGGQIMIVPVSGGAPKTIYTATGGETVGNRGGLPWAPDGRSVLFYHAREDGKAGIWQIPIDGSAPRLLVESSLIVPAPPRDGKSLPALDIRLSPDGRRLLYSAGNERGEFWMLTGFKTSD